MSAYNNSRPARKFLSIFVIKRGTRIGAKMSISLPLNGEPAPIRLDESGVVRVGNTRITLDLIVNLDTPGPCAKTDEPESTKTARTANCCTARTARFIDPTAELSNLRAGKEEVCIFIFAFNRRLLAGAAGSSSHALGSRLILGLPARDLRRCGRLPHRGRRIPTAGDNPLAVRGTGRRTSSHHGSRCRTAHPHRRPVVAKLRIQAR